MTDVHHLDDTELPDTTVVQHASDDADAHGQNAHADDGDGHDAHGHDEESLGPVDVPAWGAGIIGVLLGIAVAAAFALATAPI